MKFRNFLIEPSQKICQLQLYRSKKSYPTVNGDANKEIVTLDGILSISDKLVRE